MNKEPQQPEREEQMAAYVNGEMTLEEAAAFERLMESDERLHQEVEECRQALDAAREWMMQEAPGIDRVDALEIPRMVTAQEKLQEISLRQPAEVLTSRAKPKYSSFLRYAMAAAAIFIVGFFLGNQWPLSAQIGAPEISQKPPLQIEKEADLPSPLPIEPGETVKSRLADLGARRSVTRQNGRLIIETTLEGTNAHVLWVVDAGFRLAQPSTQQ